ncbi:MAG: zf-HC2 domain-containing protein [Lachnospiraceae bacterium]|jgi:hypothetical protein
MNCRDVQIRINPFIKDNLTEEEQSEFIFHIRNCRECMDELKLFYTIEHMINRNSDFEYEEIGRIVQAELNRRQSRISKSRRKRMYFNIGILIAELLLLVSAILIFYPGFSADSISEILSFLL